MGEEELRTKSKTSRFACMCAQRWARWWISPAPLQGFEFEATFLLSAAMFTMAGALPVLPGPCQLLWWTHINKLEGPIDMYLRHLTLNPQHDGLVKVCVEALAPCACLGSESMVAKFTTKPSLRCCPLL